MTIIDLLCVPLEIIRRLATNRRGNVLMLMGFSVIPLTLATGIAIDYARASRLQTKLNAAADAATLAAVTQPMMLKSNTEAETALVAMFNSQIAGQPGLIWNSADLQKSVTGNNLVTSTRTAVVTYTARSVNAFAGLIGFPSITIGGTSTATATAAPNIDFYLALDTSPSMALPTTTAGFTTMDSAVSCSFACHSNKIQVYVGGSIPSLILDNAKFSIVKGSFGTSGGYTTTTTCDKKGKNCTTTTTGTPKKILLDDNGSYVFENNPSTNGLCTEAGGTRDICVYNADGTFADSYWYALNKGVRLRVTDERQAASDLMTLAQSYATANSRTYRAALYTFNHSTNLQTISALTSNLSAVSTAAQNIDVVTVNDQAGNGRPPNGQGGSEYLFTSFASILTKMSTDLPLVSGRGTNTVGDTPQAFLFMVTDGMSDENIGSGRTRTAMQDAQITQCNAIKARGIKIAILYTEYTSASIQDDEPGQRAIANAAIPNIAPQLTKCASPDLMFTVKTDQSITEALQALFAKAVSSARLSN